jgi:hypothetical protein
MNAFRASEAYAQSRGRVERSADGRDADDVNFTLTINRLFETIRSESEQHRRTVAFVPPRFVPDGCLADPVLLAKQIKSALVGMGYAVERDGDKLYISWDKEDTARRAKEVALVQRDERGGEVRRAVRLPAARGPPRGFASTVVAAAAPAAAAKPARLSTVVVRKAPARKKGG